MMKPTLKNHPADYNQILENLANGGKPLDPTQANFLYRHQHALSDHGFDHAIRYYCTHKMTSNFLIPHETLTATDVKNLKRRLQLLLQEKNAKAEFRMKPAQFIQLRNLTNELILYHGNQFLTGAPFYPGGIPHLIFFQWGNLFGVAKYVVLAEEKSLKSNLMIHFENMHERQLDECVQTYIHTHPAPLTPPPPAPQPQQQHQPLYSLGIPRLTLTINKNEKTKE